MRENEFAVGQRVRVLAARWESGETSGFDITKSQFAVIEDELDDDGDYGVWAGENNFGFVGKSFLEAADVPNTIGEAVVKVQVRLFLGDIDVTDRFASFVNINREDI